MSQLQNKQRGIKTLSQTRKNTHDRVFGDRPTLTFVCLHSLLFLTIVLRATTFERLDSRPRFAFMIFNDCNFSAPVVDDVVAKQLSLGIACLHSTMFDARALLVRVLNSVNRLCSINYSLVLSATTFEKFETINNSDRIAQLIVAKVEKAALILVDTLTETERAAGGFGHTGV